MKGLIFVYLMTFGGAAAAIFKPYYGLVAYICFAVIRPNWLWHWVELPANASRIIAIAMLIGWALQGFGNRQRSRGSAITLAFVGFWCWSLVSALVAAEDKVRALWFVEILGKVLLPFLVGVTTITSVSQIRVLMWTIVGCLGYVALDLNRIYYSGYNRLYWEGYGGSDNNSFSIALVTGIGCSVFLGLTAERWWQKGIALLLAALMMNAVFFSFSRGGMLALIIMGMISFFLVPKRPIHYAVFLLVAAMGYRLMGAEATDRFMSAFVDKEERDRSAQSRLDMWKICWTVMLDKPILGCGPENWLVVGPSYGAPYGLYAHSLWMQTGAETGFIGVGFLLCFYGMSVVRSLKLARRPPPTCDPFLPHVARMVVASLVGFMVAAQFVSLWGLEVPYYIALIGAAALKLAYGPTPVVAPRYARELQPLRPAALQAGLSFNAK